jgi:phage gp45-like
MNIIRGLLIAIEQSAKKFYQKYSIDGRADEVSTGTLFQHYGFKSQPTKGCELVHLELQNNGVSVAESDNNLLNKTLNPGDVYVYSDDKNFIKLVPDSNTSTTKISIQSSGDILVKNANGQILLSQNGQVNVNQGTYFLVTKDFIDTVYSNHVHAFTGVPASSPGVTLAPTIITDPNQVTTTFKAK